MFFRNDCPKSVLLASLALFLAGCGGGGDPDADGDGDGFTNAEETMAGSDPNNALSTPDDIDADGVANDMDDDIDGDGLLDFWEEIYSLGYSSISDATGINGPDGDPDSDGFTNAAEYLAGSYPNNALSTPDDIDGDGFPNAAEMMAGSNPNIPASTPDDIDGDGFPNAAEMMVGSDPNNAVSTPDDIDGDGFPNAADTNPRLFDRTLIGANDIDDTASVNAGNAGFTLRGAAEDDQLGYSVSGAGDVNNDGIDDVIVGANRNDAGGTNAGAAYVIYGTDDDSHMDIALATDALAAADGFRILGAAAGDEFGYSVSTAGDVNGDGMDDLIVGARSNDAGDTSVDNSRAGAAYVIYGQDSTATDYVDRGNIDVGDTTGDAPTFPASAGFRILGAMSGDNLGYFVSGAGDVNGDGIDDVIVGAIGVSTGGIGAAYVIYGQDSTATDYVDRGNTDVGDMTSFSASVGFTINGAAAGDKLGYSVSAAGDVNGDGTDDLIVGARDVNSRVGAAYVIYGQTGNTRGNIDVGDTTSFSASVGFTINGAAAGDELGYSVSGAGDVNNDGIADLIVGARYNNDGDTNVANSNAGAAYVIYGQDSTATDYVDRGNIDVGDTTGDAPTFLASAGFRILGAAAGDYFGWSVSGAGDVNGDGIADLIVGAIGINSATGAAYVIYGQDSTVANYVDRGDLNVRNLSASAGFTINGVAAGDWLGWSVSGAGDVNGDGFDDLIAGANGVSTDTGAAYVLLSPPEVPEPPAGSN